MKYKRIITISKDPSPPRFEGLWFKVENEYETQKYIRTAIRMEPDEVIITKELLPFIWN